MSLNQFKPEPLPARVPDRRRRGARLRDQQLLGDEHQPSHSADRRSGRCQSRRPPDHRRRSLGARFRRRHDGPGAGRRRRSQHQPADQHNERGRRLPVLQRDHGYHAPGEVLGPAEHLPGRACIGTICPSTASPTTSARAATPLLAGCSRRRCGSTTNFGAHARQEVSVTDSVTLTAGLAVERSWLTGSQQSFTYNAAGATLTDTIDLRRPRNHQRGSRARPLMAAKLAVAVPGPRRDRIRHAAIHQSVRDLRRQARQQHGSPIAGERRLRRRRRLDAAVGRPAQRDGLLRVLRKRDRLAISRPRREFTLQCPALGASRH